MTDPAKLKPYDRKKDLWNIVIETPKGSHNKYKYDLKLGVFVLNGVLPVGMSFPFDFGYVPGTLGEDGDPVDVLVLMDAPAFCGCVVPSRFIGVIEAEQTERDGQVNRNDRLIAIADKAETFGDIRKISDLNGSLTREIKAFFANYTGLRGKKFKLLAVSGPDQAASLAKRAMRPVRRRRQG